MSESAPPALRALAPAKINLGLFLGPTRSLDARHELLSVMQSISLADELTLSAAPEGAEADRVACPGVPGAPAENLAARALASFRERTGWRAPPLTLAIEKRIPLAAGLAGGSADAAATLRLAHAASGLGERELLLEIALELGADVPAQLAPGRWLARGAGERLTELPAPRPPFGVLVLASEHELSTAAVYAEADRLGSPRAAAELERLDGEVRRELGDGSPLPARADLLENDLQRAAVSLCPEIDQTLARARESGAQRVLLSGSGPTVLGLFAREGEDGPAAAAAAAEALGGEASRAFHAVVVEGDFGAVVRSTDGGAGGLGARADGDVRNNSRADG